MHRDLRKNKGHRMCKKIYKNTYKKRKIIVFGLLLMSIFCAACSDSAYIQKKYQMNTVDDSKEEAEKSLLDTEDAENSLSDTEFVDNVADIEGSASENNSETKDSELETNEKSETIKETEKVPEENQLVIHICGAVVNPGVYELPQGARVVQAIEAAGGLRADADLVMVNQARHLEDGEQIQILTKEEAEAVKNTSEIEGNRAGTTAGYGNGQSQSETAGDAAKVNINLANAAELMSLPGIGQAKAEAIIKYREANGKFTSITDIMKISGIKESVFSKIRDLITI